MDIADANLQIIIAFALTMIVLLLVYIAFFKDVEKHHPKRPSEK